MDLYLYIYKNYKHSENSSSPHNLLETCLSSVLFSVPILGATITLCSLSSGEKWREQ